MDKLSNDELILIIIQMKKNYEFRYNKLEKKFNSLKTYLDDEDKMLIYHHTCTYCNHPIYKIFDCEESCESNFRECYTCDNTNCMNCFDDNKLEKINDKYYCKECNSFKTKMDEIK